MFKKCFKCFKVIKHFSQKIKNKEVLTINNKAQKVNNFPVYDSQNKPFSNPRDLINQM